MAATLELAISAIRAGRKEEGRQLLNLLIQQNPNNDKAWLWMSSVVNTDEQRARCLYHVLAIDPNSEIARRGLQLLGIVVSDSRPVKIPRDSQPIPIPKPSNPQERRPFLIDPQAIADELPFTPVAKPPSKPVQPSASVLAIDVEKVGTEAESGSNSPISSGQNEPAKPQSAPVPVAQSTQTQRIRAPQPPPEPVQQTENVDTQPLPENELPAAQPNPSEPMPAVRPDQSQPPAPQQAGHAQHPSEPVPAQQPNVSSNPMSGSQIPPQTDSRPVQPNEPYQGTQPMPGNQHYAAGPMNPPPPNETRPSQPMPVTDPNMGAGQNNQWPPYAGQSPMYPHHSDATVGTAYQQGQGQPPSQPVPPLHSNSTLGMPPHSQSGQGQHPSEPVPVIHSQNTLGMNPYGQVYMPFGPNFHSNATMMMPSMSEAEARARLGTGQAIPTANAMAMPLQNASNPSAGAKPVREANQVVDEDDDSDDEVNILAVIIFGTLSVTALGGLGMLILLMFTAPV